MVIPGPSCAVVGAEVLRGREAAAGPRVERRREEEPREAAAFPPVREADRPEPRGVPDAGTGRLAARGAPGRLEVMPKGYPSGREPRERRRAGVGRGVVELLLDAQELVVLVDPLTTGGG